jgi:glycosyltransferase involved in cell wall biosynthesis
MKLVVITCYHDPDYIRARTLRAALKQVPGLSLIVLKNHHRGWLRYPEVLWRLWRIKRTRHPDAYLLTFRGQEILPFVLLLARKKPVIFDEFIVPIAYATGEHHRRNFGTMVKHGLARFSEPLYRRWLKRCRLILADTAAHADLSARTSNMNLRKYIAVPVGADESVFQPGQPAPSETFQVFYYSTGMQPLHGIGTVLAAAEELQQHANITFLIVGGKRPMARAVRAAAARGAHVTHKSWIAFNDLPKTMRQSSICLGGPFGDTPQAHNVITGKTYQMLACASPVIVGDSPATAEHFVDKQNALVVPQADAAALAKAILWASKHPAELQAIAQNGRKLYEKSFSVSAIAQTLLPVSSLS